MEVIVVEPAGQTGTLSCFDSVTASTMSLVQDIKVAADKVAKLFGVNISRTRDDGAPQNDSARILTSTLQLLTELGDVGERVARATQALEDAVSCCVSLQPMQHPVLAKDGQAYERSWIFKWVSEHGVSPLTKEPLTTEYLLRDRPLEKAAEAWRILVGMEGAALGKDGTDWHEDRAKPDASDDEVGSVDSTEADTRMRVGEPLHLVGVELLEAIESGQEALVLQMLAQAVDSAVLNGLYGEQKASLLHLCLINGLPMASLALMNRADFNNTGNWMGVTPGISTLHLAATCGELHVCQALLARCGLQEANCEAERYINVEFWDGSFVEYRPMNTPIGLAKRHKHKEVVELLTTAWDTHLLSLGLGPSR